MKYVDYHIDLRNLEPQHLQERPWPWVISYWASWSQWVKCKVLAYVWFPYIRLSATSSADHEIILCNFIVNWIVTFDIMDLCPLWNFRATMGTSRYSVLGYYKNTGWMHGMVYAYIVNLQLILRQTLNNGPGSLLIAYIHAFFVSSCEGNLWNDSSGWSLPLPLHCGTQQCFPVHAVAIVYCVTL